MERTLVLAHLAQAERHIREGEGHLLRQLNLSAMVVASRKRQRWQGTSWRHLKWRRQHILPIRRSSYKHYSREHKARVTVAYALAECPLLGVKRTSVGSTRVYALDPSGTRSAH